MSWKKQDIEYLKNNLGKLSFAEIALQLKRTERSVQLFVHRYRLQVDESDVRNLVKELLTIKFVDPSYFTPTRLFYKAVNINQKRWWDLYNGRSKVTEEEYIRLIDHFKVSLQDAFDARQLTLFDK